MVKAPKFKDDLYDDHLNRVMEFTQVMLTYHSDDTLMHFQHVKRYSKLLCMKFNDLYPEHMLSDMEIRYICEGARLHDIGKIIVPDEVLRKKGSLSNNEYEEVKMHTVVGSQIVDHMADIFELGDDRKILCDICMYHHERYDGKGYPEGLVGDQIPLSAQIVSVAEVYDSLTMSNYKSPITHDAAMKKILSGECGVFNPKLLICLQYIESDFQLILNTKSEERWELLEGVYNKNHQMYWLEKRIMDVTLSSLALIALSPLMLLIALAIYIDDPHGSPIFKQVRLGRHKKPFTMYKFRTMVVNAEELKQVLMSKNEKDGPVFKIADDPRITHIGKFLRKTSLDELPQLINIIKGDMSIVGPRPPLPSEVENYSRYQEMRLSITPGLTCIWQMQPKRDDISFDSWVDMDVAYIGTRSLRKDIEIIFQTVLAVLHKSGS